ncbi:ABC transporter permease [Terriglobus albidus]|uniref:ABC transporter permease n=1 Tax=Terriglobus albidus TaxID=1592106 RepID=A0A5B9E8F7_9BACT|nr:ABC transporter permease [Terriglobus albidus]QEE28069.1 ABC transporter permease [Terriglobus albidus]
MPNNIFLIAKREYLERVRTKSFLVTTMLIPLLMGGGILFSVVKSRHSKAASHIAVVAADTDLALALQDELEHGKDSAMQVDVISPPTGNTRQAVVDETAEKQIDGFLWIDVDKGKPKATYTSMSNADISTMQSIESALRRAIVREGMQRKGVDAGEIKLMMAPVDLETETIRNGEISKSDTMTAFFGAYVLFFLMYMAVMLHGMNVARSIIEEKTSRVFEVMLATVQPQEMMAGKLLGVGSVGLTQIGIWVLAALGLSAAPMASAVGAGAIHISFSAGQIIAFIGYFVMGFLLYSGMAAAIGAMVNSEQELQQFNMVIALPMAVCMFVLVPVISNPNSPFSRIISLIPTCTPLIMYLRIAISNPPWYDIAASVVILLATIYGVLWLTARIYRVGILMYGKRPTLPEILKWLKYS